MNQNKKMIISSILICTLIIASIITVTKLITGEIVIGTKVNSYISKTHDKPMEIKADSNYSYKGKDYRIIFATAEDRKNELYLQCFEEKFKGLAYKPTYGASQGNSLSLYGMINHFLNNSANESFFVVYGYNKDLKANNFSVRKTDTGEWITQDISNQEYFLYIYTDIEYGNVVFKDNQNHDLFFMFNGQ